jgi:hypothetical protein
MHLNSQPVAEIRHLQIATGFDCGSRSGCSRKKPTSEAVRHVQMPYVAYVAKAAAD